MARTGVGVPPRTRSASASLGESGHPPPDDATGAGAPRMPALLSAAEVARIFGRSRRTLRDWARAGHLRPVRVGRSVFFRADNIDALIGSGGPRGQEEGQANP
ncbi:hypothetical protein GCM10009416_13120 [Craurococcus roseus]|uniref:Helix-turn-helix domain-containing protein n=1 Tax=Craurococcus roseus TaxID=77585 RepID=A0ABP3PYP6_9PROT